MTSIPENTIDHVRKRMKQATLPYRSLLEDTTPVIEHVLTALRSVDAVKTNDINPTFLHRIACEQLFARLREKRISTTSTVAPFSSLTDDQCLASFLAAMGYSERDASELIGWSPRKYRNLLRSAEVELKVSDAHQWTSHQLRFALEATPQTPSCPSSMTIWSCAHGDVEPEEVVPNALHTAHCGHCSELWLLAWGIDPQLQRGPFLTRSDTEDMRDIKEPITINTRPSPDTPSSMRPLKQEHSWLGPIALRGIIVLLTLTAFAYLLS